jgi:hypothetical protein
VRLGGAGTPVVLEFAAAELGPRIGRSAYSARMLVADALDVRHRLPRVWSRVCAGEVPVGNARHVAQQTRELTVEGAGVVDAGVAEYADGRLTWSRFETLVAAKVVEADPQAAAEREHAAAAGEFAKVGRCNDHGQKTLYVRSSAAAVIRMDATIAFLAALGDTDTEDRRRAKAMLVLANPVQAVQLLQAFAAHRDGSTPATSDGTEPSGPTSTFVAPLRPDRIRPDRGFQLGFDPRILLPTVTLYLHLYADPANGTCGSVARWEGEGPITSTYVRDILGPHCRFSIKPVIDIAGIAPVDAYEIPDRHREAVQLRTPADVFPYASSTRRHHQLDHTRPYVSPDHGGPPDDRPVRGRRGRHPVRTAPRGLSRRRR